MATSSLQVIIFIWKINLSSVLHLLLVLLQDCLIDLNFWRGESRGSNEFEGLIADEFAGKPTVSRLVMENKQRETV
jgi:hypothetical protein